MEKIGSTLIILFRYTTSLLLLFAAVRDGAIITGVDIYSKSMYRDLWKGGGGVGVPTLIRYLCE